MSSSGNGLTNGKAAKKRRRRIIIGSIVALVLIGGGYGVYAALRPNHEIDPSKLAAAERGDLAKVVVATGKIQPLSKVEVKSKASGIVKKLYVDYGDHVKAGQLLAELDKIQLEASLRAAQANYQAAQAAKDSSEATLERNKVDAKGRDVPFHELNGARGTDVQGRRDVQEPGGRRREELSARSEQASERAKEPGSIARGDCQSCGAGGASQGSARKRGRGSAQFNNY